MSKYINEFPQHLVSPGVPAFNYRVYFGEPNQNPLTNPKTVYSDKGLNTPIAQPLILNSDGLYGQEVFLNGEYSIQINTPSTVANPDGVIWQSAPFIAGTAGSINTVGNIAEAKASTSLLDGQGVYILGYTTEGDGGGGMYVYDASSAATANDGTVLALDTLAGRLLHGETTPITVKTFGALGAADDTVALANATDWLENKVLNFADGQYVVSSADTYRNINIKGEHLSRLETSVTNGSLGNLQNNVTLERMTIDGNSGTSNILSMGSDDAGQPTDNFWILENIFIDAPINLLRATEYGSKVVIANNQSANCKLFNTFDRRQGTQFIVYANIVDDVIGEGALFDCPAFKSAYHGTVHFGNIYQSETGGQRLIGYAGIKGFVDFGNIYRGANGVSKDVFHIEDTSRYGVVSNNLMLANGAAAAIDCALGGDFNYLHINTPSAAFTVGETITGGSSGATAVVDIYTTTIIDVSSVAGAFTVGETITGGTSGSTAIVNSRETESVILTSNAIVPDGAKGIEMDGSAPEEFRRITLSNNHIEHSSAPINARLADSAVIGNVIHDADLPIKIIKSDSIISGQDSPTGQNVVVTQNHYINQNFIRGNVGLCFDPNNLLFRSSFADSGSGLTFGGSLGTGGTVTYPVSIAGDGIAGVKYLRATAGSTAMTRRIDINFDSTASDIQNGDTISVQIMCRSSAPARGKLDIGLLSAGPASSVFDLPTTSEWQVLGGVKNIPSAADMFAAGADNVLIDIYLGENLASGETFDIAWIKVSHVRGY